MTTSFSPVKVIPNLVTTYLIYRSIEEPIDDKLISFLVGMAALAHERIDKF